MTVSLTNTSNRCQVFVLAHESYCQALGACACSLEPGRGARRLARSLTLAAGTTSPEQDDAVLAVPEVVRAARRGELAVKRHVAALAAPAPRLVPPSPTPAVSPETGRPDATKSTKKRGAG